MGSTPGLLFGGLFLTGLAGSLHCLGMCGPILLAFSRLLSTSPREEPVSENRPLRSTSSKTGLALGFSAYHLGRLWTYGLLGLVAGWAGSSLRLGSAYLGWQRPLMVLTSVLVIAVGAAAWLPGPKLGLSFSSSCFSGRQGQSWFKVLTRDRRLTARLLVGAVMGLLPCGLVYSMLLVVATFPTPLHSALGMICFGAGTLPALTALVLGGHLLPSWLRAAGPRLTAGLLIAVGLFMLARAVMVDPRAGHHSPHPAPRSQGAEVHQGPETQDGAYTASRPPAGEEVSQEPSAIAVT